MSRAATLPIPASFIPLVTPLAPSKAEPKTPLLVPAVSPYYYTFSRVRFTSYHTSGTLLPTGMAVDGEVEDDLVVTSLIFADGFESSYTSWWSTEFP